MTYILGLDGGNSKTIALVARTDGTIIGAGRAGNSDIYGAPSVEAAFAELDRAVGSALTAAGIETSDIAAGGFSMAGADWPEDADVIGRRLRERSYGRRITVVNDALGALWAGSLDRTGVAVVCGTGAATGARAADGREWHTSWWQEAHGSRHLAEKALRAVYRADLGIDPPTALTPRLLELYGKRTVEDVLHARTRRDGGRLDRHDLVTRALLAEADGGDETSRRIVREHGASLGEYAAVAAGKVGLQNCPFALVLAGGVFRHGGTLLADALVERVHRVSPEAEPAFSRFQPVVGALFLALDTLGLGVDDGMLGRLTETLPGEDLFAT